MVKRSWMAAGLVWAGIATPLAAAPAGEMSPAEAEALVKAFETQEATRATTPALRQPSTRQDALAILKRDQIDLFGGGVAVAKKYRDRAGLALQAQLELAWGGGQEVLVFLLGNLRRMVDATLAELESRPATERAQRAESAAALTKNYERLGRTIEALRLVSSTHIARGAKLAEVVIARYPDDYIGYRVAADYYRLVGRWDDFDKMVAKIEATRPSSIGLLFLRGIAAAERDGDPEAAAEFFQRALASDPEFVRAQAHLLLVQTSLEGTYLQLKKLAAKNPTHQIVTWAGPVIEALHAFGSSQRGGHSWGDRMIGTWGENVFVCDIFWVLRRPPAS